jgi:hypothetical protein
LEVAEEHHYVFDPEDFNFVAIRDRIRCYYKSYVQTARKRGQQVSAIPPSKKQKVKQESRGTDTEADIEAEEKDDVNIDKETSEAEEKDDVGKKIEEKKASKENIDEKMDQQPGEKNEDGKTIDENRASVEKRDEKTTAEKAIDESSKPETKVDEAVEMFIGEKSETKVDMTTVGTGAGES